MLVVVHVAARADDGFGWLTWGSVLLATQLGGVLTILQILAAVALTEGHISRAAVRQMFGMDFVVTLTGTAMALVASILWIERPSAAPLLFVPILVACLGYRAHARERQGHEKVKFLYETNRTLSESPEVARPRRAARARARGLPGRAGRGHPLRRRRRHAAAHRARPGQCPRGDGADGPRRRERAARAGRDLGHDRRAPDPLPAGKIGAYLTERGIRHGMLCAARTASSARSCSPTATGSRAASPPATGRCSRRSPRTRPPRCSSTASSRPSPSCATCRTSSPMRPTTIR